MRLRTWYTINKSDVHMMSEQVSVPATTELTRIRMRILL
jgi:hypothetical protein